MTNLLPQNLGGTPTTGGTTTAAQPDLSSLVGNLTGSTSTPLTGGTDPGAISSAAFNPSLYEPGGLFSPTGTQQPATPAAQQAQQDPSGQVPTAEQLDRSSKSDRATTQDQQPTTRSAQADPSAGPTGLGGDQTGGARQSGLAKLAQALAGPQAKRPAAAVDAAGAAQPAAAPPQPQPAGAPPPAQPAPARGSPPAPQVPGAQPPAAVGAAPAGATGAPAVPPLLQALLNLLGLGGLTGGGRQSLGGVAQQAYPQRQFTPISPTARLGAYARARSRAMPGQYEQPTQEEWNRNVSSGRGFGPAPGVSGEVSAPTAQQVQQGRLAGTDTPPTEGFSPVLERERSKFRDELNNPRVRWETLAMIALEQGGDPAAVAESLLNRSDYAKKSIHNMLHSGFYGPVNFGKLGAEMRRLQANPARAAKLNAGLETALRGSNLLGGATDQGAGRDPNVGHSGGRVIRFGETYNDWGGGPGGHEGAANYRRQQQQRVRAGQQEAQRGDQLAMDISRRVPIIGGPEFEGAGRLRARGGMTSPLLQILEERRKRERGQQEEAAPS